MLRKRPGPETLEEMDSHNVRGQMFQQHRVRVPRGHKRQCHQLCRESQEASGVPVLPSGGDWGASGRSLVKGDELKQVMFPLFLLDPPHFCLWICPFFLWWVRIGVFSFSLSCYISLLFISFLSASPFISFICNDFAQGTLLRSILYYGIDFMVHCVHI